jgi:hypothetical protein
MERGAGCTSESKGPESTPDALKQIAHQLGLSSPSLFIPFPHEKLAPNLVRVDNACKGLGKGLLELPNTKKLVDGVTRANDTRVVCNPSRLSDASARAPQRRGMSEAPASPNKS